MPSYDLTGPAVRRRPLLARPELVQHRLADPPRPARRPAPRDAGRTGCASRSCGDARDTGFAEYVDPHTGAGPRHPRLQLDRGPDARPADRTGGRDDDRRTATGSWSTGGPSPRSAPPGTSPERRGASPDGLFLRDARHLSRWRLTAGGAPLHGAHRTDDGVVLVPPGTRDEPPAYTVFRDQAIATGALAERVTLLNNLAEPADVTVELAVDADFADQFELRSDRRGPRQVRRRTGARRPVLPDVELPLPARPRLGLLDDRHRRPAAHGVTARRPGRHRPRPGLAADAARPRQPRTRPDRKGVRRPRRQVPPTVTSPAAMRAQQAADIADVHPAAATPRRPGRGPAGGPRGPGGLVAAAAHGLADLAGPAGAPRSARTASRCGCRAPVRRGSSPSSAATPC